MNENQKPTTDKYRDGWDAIFKNAKVKEIDEDVFLVEVKEEEKEGDNFSLNDLLTKLSINMDEADKNTVNQILIEEKWKKS